MSETIFNASRFVADSFLSVAALRREFGARIPSDAEIEKRYRDLRRIWQRAVVGGRVGDSSNQSRTIRDLYEPLLRNLGFDSPLCPLEVELDPARVTLQTFASEDHKVTLLLDPLPFALSPDDRLASGGFRGTAQRRIERALSSSATRFGLILGGSRWRIVQLDTANEPRYLEFDLDAIVEADDVEAFGLLTVLVSPTFLLGETPMLEALIAKSEELGTEVSDKLGPATRRALEQLLEGVRADERNAEWAAEAFVEGERLQEIHHEGIHFLYRLLFVLYAEAAVPPALPIDKSLYRDSYSLERLRQRLSHDVDLYPENQYGLWESVKALFRLIDRGASTKEFHIPAYNGGLFSGDRTPHLNLAALNDRGFASVLRELTTVVIGKGAKRTRDRVSFRELGVGQLGAVFESLLDFEPRIAQESLYEVTIGSGKQKAVSYLPASALDGPPNGSASVAQGRFYLQAWGGQRRSTGAYYTPKIIADYLVREALGPHIKGKTSDEILGISVCDPAMGSGGFLVSATELLGEAYYQALVREGLRDLGDDHVDLDRIEAKRIVAERCIYGVDVNPLAVELAKVSLWLATLSYDRPLSFFDHHLRCGNSLLGAPLRDDIGTLTSARIQVIPQEAFGDFGKESVATRERLKKAYRRNAAELRAAERGGVSMFALDLAQPLHDYAEARRLLSADDPTQSAADAVERIRGKERQLRELTQNPQSPFFKLKQICDTWMAPWFWTDRSADGLPTTDDYQALARELWEDGGTPTHEREALLTEVNHLAQQIHFFHWELEFPEVFESGGFSVIVGNPPYAAAYSRESHKSQQEEAFRFISVLGSQIGGMTATSGRQNTFVYFTVLASRLAAARGSVAFVLPDPLRTAKSYAPLRTALVRNGSVRLVIAFRESIFTDATVESCLLIFDHLPGSVMNLLTLNKPSELALEPASVGIDTVDLLASPDCRWVVKAMIDTLQHTDTVNLGDIAFIKDGINPGAAAVRSRLISGQRRSTRSRKLIEGRDITEFKIVWSGKWVEYDESKVSKAERKAGTSLRKEWIFTSPKIVYRQTAPTVIAAVDRAGYFTTNSVHSVVLKQFDDELLYALAGYINSSVARASYAALFGENRAVFPQVHISDAKRLPIPKYVIEAGAVRSRIAAIVRKVQEEVESEVLASMAIQDIDKIMIEAEQEETNAHTSRRSRMDMVESKRSTHPQIGDRKARRCSEGAGPARPLSES
jgi:hypothetical protein